MSKHPIDTRLLGHISLFEPLDDEQLSRIIAATHVVELSEGEALFSQGQQAERFYFVVEGLIKLSRLSLNGHEKIVELTGPGRLFGEAILFMDHQRYPINATALERSVLYGFPIGVYRDLLNESTGLCLVLCGAITRRLHELLDEVDRVSLQNASLRVVNYLIGQLPSHTDNAAVIDLVAPKQVIAARLSITPETLSRILRTLTDQHIIDIHGKTIAVHDVRALREFGHQDHAVYAPRRRML